MKTNHLPLGIACTLVALISWNTEAHAFCMQVTGVPHCVDQGHSGVTRFIKPILRNQIYQRMWTGNFRQDFDNARHQNEIHFDSCRFASDGGIRGGTDYIRTKYRDAVAELDPSDPHVFEAAHDFGQLLHPVQDFYAHSNWIDLLDITAPSMVNPVDHLVDRSTSVWRELGPLSSLGGDMIVGQIPAGGLPSGWGVTQELTSEVPTFTTDAGDVFRGLVTGYNASGACPDVREGTIIDEYSHLEIIGLDVLGRPIHGDPVPRTKRLTHGESIILGSNHDTPRPCHDGYPTHVCLQKDHEGRPGYDQAALLAEYQTAHEWCRFLNLAKDSEFGYAASSILMTLFANPEDEPFGPHPISTPCETPFAVRIGRTPGPIEVKISAQEIRLHDEPTGDVDWRYLTFALYTGDLKRSLYSTSYVSDDERIGATEPETICVNPGDELVATVWGWDDRAIPLVSVPAKLDNYDILLRGVTQVLDGPGFEPGEHVVSSDDMTVTFDVRVEESDTDGDGLSACGESFYETDPADADTDDDGLDDGAEVSIFGSDPLDPDTDDDALTDGEEVNIHGTDPLDPDTDADGLDDYVEVNISGTDALNPDTDDDGLTDGAEANTHGTDPLDADTDDDRLDDGAEVNTHGTDPLDPDTDDDGLDDGLEVSLGVTDPLNWDSDGDGLADGGDVEFLSEAIASTPDEAWKNGSNGLKNATEKRLLGVERAITKGKPDPLSKLVSLRKRFDGCGASADSNDWVVSCDAQTFIQSLFDLLESNLP